VDGAVARQSGAGLGHPGPGAEPVYLYGGRFNHNYGHFLVDVLSRYWTLADQRGAKPKILVHHPDPQDYLARYPFARLFFAALGLAPEDFVAFDRPVRLERVIVPWTSFRHQTHAHRAYARLGRRIGEAMLAGRTPRPSDRPVYLSKTGLTAGIRRFINEAEVERELAANGVDILRPRPCPCPNRSPCFAERPR
jgi:capsular polysaccharide biosynthesis protein